VQQIFAVINSAVAVNQSMPSPYLQYHCTGAAILGGGFKTYNVFLPRRKHETRASGGWVALTHNFLTGFLNI